MFRACCDRSGTISFTSGPIPAGSLPIARHDNPALLRGSVAALARVAYDQKSLMVPGVPEALNGEQALKALITFTERVTERLRADLDQTTGSKERVLVPRDGDVAHRNGCKKGNNPFTPGTDLYANWDDDWQFRENCVRGNASAGPGEEG